MNGLGSRRLGGAHDGVLLAEIPAWFGLQVAVVHLHVHDLHELHLGRQLLDLLLLIG